MENLDTCVYFFLDCNKKIENLKQGVSVLNPYIDAIRLLVIQLRFDDEKLSFATRVHLRARSWVHFFISDCATVAQSLGLIA